jgi:ABC-type oligopeptide transport system substrate-binding subunit/DNA-binding SARP family transcriptional activator
MHGEVAVLSRLCLSFLGAPLLEREGEPIRLDTRKNLALVAYLALTGEPHTREALVTLFWPEVEPSRARAGLRRNLAVLRNELGGEWLIVDRESVGTDPEADVWLDVSRFRQLMRAWQGHGHPEAEVCAECLVALGEAVELYRGDFLEGFSLRDSPGFDEWQFFQTEGLRQELTSALERLVRGYSAQGSYEPAIPYARRWLALDPLHEPVHRTLMQLYAWSGQHSAALRQYGECERLLAEELGVSPEEKTTQLYKAIKAKRDLPPPERAPLTPAEPTTLGGRYRLGTALGRGGGGVVYRAHDSVLDREVAVKLYSTVTLDDEGRARLLEQAQAAARLSHPNIASLYDAGEAQRIPFIVTELVEGTSLHAHRPEVLEDVLDIAHQVCAALEHAHGQGIVHRDLKPENILVTPSGLVKVTDLGLARPVASRITSEGLILGTVSYLAPEFALGQRVDGRADLYALGVILYELTTDRLPFDANDPLAVISQHLHAPAVPPRAWNPEIPPALDALIVQLLSKDPQDRPGTATAVLQALESPGLLDRAAAPGEELSLLERMERGRMVGREREMAEARALWSRVLAGQGQLLLVSGEPGIGKTRLVRELSARVEISGGAALSAACFAESGAPYAPVAQLIRVAFSVADKPDGRKLIPLSAVQGSEVEGSGLAGSEVGGSEVGGMSKRAERPNEFGSRSALIPPRGLTERSRRTSLDLSEATLDALGMLAPDCCGEPRELRDRPELDPHADQERLFDSLVELFQALTRRAPLLIVLEDVHWADSGTLSMVRRLSRHVPGMRLLLALTYREVELGESRALNDLLYELSRQRQGERVKLTRLSREETAELLRAMFAEQPSPQLVDLIFRETEGNPFFIEEVCKALVDEGRIMHQSGRWQAASLADLGIPQSVRMAIEARVGRLPEMAQEALRLAAIFGREFDFEALCLVAQAGGDGEANRSEEALIDALEAAERAQLITEAPHTAGERRLGGKSVGARTASGRQAFSFTHALIPSALLDEMSTMRRQRLHRRAGLALERLTSERPSEYPREDLASQLSRHFIEAGDHAKAVDYLLQVGDRARQLFAYPEAIEAYEQAQEFLKEQGQYDLAARTLMKLGLVYHLAYDFPRSRKAYQDGFNLWQLAADHPQAAVDVRLASRPFHAPSGSPRSLDPARGADVESGEFIFQLFEGLAEQTPDGNLVPAVARSWDVSEGGKRYVFRLRQDARWSDGTPLTAHDFVFGWLRTLHPATASPLASLLYDVRGARRFHSGEMTDPDSVGVSATDDWTLVVELDEPVGYFIHLMAQYAAFPAPAHAIQVNGDDWATVGRLVCNGPFVLADWQPGVSITLERNPHYAGRFPGNLQAAELDLTNDYEGFQERYQAGELDFAGLGGHYVERMRYRYPGDYLTSPIPGLSFIGFNQAHPPLDDVRVRRALVHATNRQDLVDLLAHGYPMPVAGGFLPPGIPGYSPDTGLGYDPERARDLLAQAGYPGGRGFPELNLYTSVSKDLDSMGELVRRGWQETLGITLRLQHTDLIENFHTLNLAGLWFITWVADYPDADNFLRVALGHYQVLQYWKNLEFNRLVEEARRCLDPGRRAQMYREADRLLTEDAVLMPLNYFRRHMLVKPWVKNFRPGMMPFFYLKDVILEA